MFYIQTFLLQCFLIKDMGPKSAYEVCEEQMQHQIKFSFNRTSHSPLVDYFFCSISLSHCETRHEAPRNSNIPLPHFFLSLSHHLQPPAVPVLGARKQLESPLS